MSEQAAAKRALEIEAEKQVLLKAEADIEDGWNRLRNQQSLVMALQAAGHNTTEAERLAQMFRRTLVEWERHRVLIQQRIAYLQAKNLWPDRG